MIIFETASFKQFTTEATVTLMTLSEEEVSLSLTACQRGAANKE